MKMKEDDVLLDMNYFETRADRSLTANLNDLLTPDAVRRAGVVNYWGAEFDFRTCPAFCEGVMECARRASFGFTVQDDRYNGRVMWWMENMRGWKIAPDWILPTHGTIYALATALRLCVGAGEHAVTITPGYNRYRQAAERMGMEMREVSLQYLDAGTEKARYALDFDALEAAMGAPGAKLLVLCNPNNPTGTVFGRAELERIAALSQRYGVAVFSDEIFAEVTMDDAISVLPYAQVAGEEALAITCTSLGKCMSLTGVNHANVIIPNAELREAYRRRRDADHYGSIDPMLYAGLCSAYSPAGRDFVEAMRLVVRKNAARMIEALEALPGVHVIRPEGSFVIWADFSGLGLEDAELDRFLNEEALLFGGKGGEFGAEDGFRRYSIAVPPSELTKSLELFRCAAIRRGFLAG